MPFNRTIGSIHGSQAITLSKLRFWPLNKNWATGMAVTANMKNPMSPIVTPNLIFPFFRKIESRELPETIVSTMITVTIMKALVSISIRNPLGVLAGKLTRKSIDSAKDAMKKANMIRQ
jgi:hypothetical protein